MKKRFRILAVVLALFVFFDVCPPAAGEAASGFPAPVAETASGQGSYVFRPGVCSVYMEEVFGKPMCETWLRLVDAVMAGEDTFACPDQHTYDWVMGQFPRLCFPVLTELISYAKNRQNSVRNGVAGFTYLVPREEAAARIAEFAKQIEQILNETLRDDYSDFEKALALYDYFFRNFQYDWETYERAKESYVDYTTTLRLFRTGKGICSEIAPAYSYLLMQAGVDATVMMGNDHEWSYVLINGCNYHIDPTYVLDSDESLAYFMMTDTQRGKDGFDPEKCTIVSNYSQDHPHPSYTADNDSFSVIWDYQLEAFLPEEHRLRCWKWTEGWEKERFVFDYEQADESKAGHLPEACRSVRNCSRFIRSAAPRTASGVICTIPGFFPCTSSRAFP